MTIPGIDPAFPTQTRAEESEALRAICREFEAIYLRKLFETMRAAGGEEEQDLFGESTAETMFESMFDDQMASEAAQRLQRGLGEALYRQLARRLNEGE